MNLKNTMLSEKSKIGKTYIECSTNEVFKSKIILDIIRDMHKQEQDKQIQSSVCLEGGVSSRLYPHL